MAARQTSVNSCKLKSAVPVLQITEHLTLGTRLPYSKNSVAVLEDAEVSNANMWVLWIVSALLLTTGCGNCDRSKCAQVLALIVYDVNGAKMSPNDQVTLASTRAWSPCATEETCTFRLDSAGDYTVTAPGFKSVEVHVADEKDDCGASVSQSIEVTLVTEGDSSSSTSKRTLGAGCS